MAEDKKGDKKAKPAAKQAAKPLGVCNEHGPTPEGKMCSELHGNMEKPVISAGFYDVAINAILHHRITDCNTNYLFLRPHRDRNMVPLDPDRFSINQDAMIRLIGWAGNMTVSNS